MHFESNAKLSNAMVRICNGDQTAFIFPSFADNEVLSSSIDGVTTSFTLANIPIAGSVHVIYNAGRQDPTQYSVQNNTLILNFVPQLGDTLVVDYRY